VIATLRENLMAPDDVREFVAEFTEEWNRLVAERNAARAHDQTQLGPIQRKIDKLVEALMEGFRSEEIKQQFEVLSQQKAQLQARVTTPRRSIPTRRSFTATKRPICKPLQCFQCVHRHIDGLRVERSESELLRR
jgi:hypothetical protein